MYHCQIQCTKLKNNRTYNGKRCNSKTRKMNIIWHKYTGEPIELSDKESYTQIKFNDLNACIQEGWRQYKVIK